MKKLIFIAILIPLASFALENELTPFTTDGCSVVPDFSFTGCCVAHDMDYYGGGTYEERKASDLRLKQCVTERSNRFMGNMFYWGVRLGGGPNRPSTFRWGYGWKYIRKYGPLSEEEKLMVKANLPVVAKSFEITTPKKNYFEVPTQFGNHCLDQVYTEIDEYYKEREVKVTKIREREDYYYKFIYVKMDNGDKWKAMIKLRDWDYCQMPHYSLDLPDYVFSNRLIYSEKRIN